MSQAQPRSPEPEAGISLALAHERSRAISNVRYELGFEIPSERATPIRGRERMQFTLAYASPVTLDFAVPDDHLLSITVAGTPVYAPQVNGHIVVPREVLRAGENALDIEFLAGDVSLNRSADFLYTLFVPARASQAFPCFDQPDLKARYSLTLTVPDTWQVVANGAESGREAAGDRIRVRFAQTEPLPTYLFAFAAGRFLVEESDRNGRHMRMFHRETDAAKVARNREAIFDLHAAALEWLERYTGIPYRFGKFDFVLIPAFQFGGMEHAGAILYNASGLMLDETATQNQLLGRASVIAHETSHMWFGDLVTMRWFNDVWMKEVFANFMAAKIVNPSFPQINHELRFLLAHYPAAYDIDRTEGTNAIRQALANLNEAGSLYGAIIYQKAPTVMRQLEERIGADRMQQGLREYLQRYAFGNATWPDLIDILDRAPAHSRSDELKAESNVSLRTWSEAWVSEEGRPAIRSQLRLSDGKIAEMRFSQADPYQARGLVWPQRLDVTLGYEDGERTIRVDLDGATADARAAHGLAAPLYVLPNGRGRGYGRFVLDKGSLEYLLGQIEAVSDGLTRGSAWVTLWDAMLYREVTPSRFAEVCLRTVGQEPDEQLTQRVLGYLERAYWKFLGSEQRTALAPKVEATLREGLARAQGSSRKSAWFSAFRDMALTPAGVAWMERVWQRKEPVPGLTFSENDEIAMAQELAVRDVSGWAEILRVELERIQNPDRKARFAFVMPALSADPAERDRFVSRLADPDNRRHEPWVLDGLRYVHHPLRAKQSEKYVLPALGMLREIQRTGDIFFPKRWCDAVLDGHAERSTAEAVRH
ncbi:MAG: M1 family metallopeptidase, partial [Acidobacteriota bacterium]